jgi:hypothetical protein
MKRIVCIGLLLTTSGLVVTAPAESARRFAVETFINPDGTGQMLASGTAPWKWEACTAEQKGCEPFARGREANTAGVPAGTVFRLRDGSGELSLSPEWRGPLKELAPPRVAGVLAANEFVSPVPGLWGGGWRGENSEMQLSACITGSGSECVSLTDPSYYRVGCSRSDSFALEPRFVGWYLRIADRQSGGPHLEAGTGSVAPFGAEPLRRSRNTSVSIVGQIAPAVNPPAGECGPPPAPTATVSAAGQARVECAGGCTVLVVGTRKGRRQVVTRRIHAQDLLRPAAALEVGLSGPALARLGAGRIRLTVEVDGKPLARRTIRTSDS